MALSCSSLTPDRTSFPVPIPETGTPFDLSRLLVALDETQIYCNLDDVKFDIGTSYFDLSDRRI
jgi:hypothetical protein